MADLVQKLRDEECRREAQFMRSPMMNPPMKFTHDEPMRALLGQAATELEALRKRCEAVEADAARWRHVRDERTWAYGDGYTEPEECSIHLEWQQGPWIRDGSNGGAGRKDCFPGWDAIVDQMIADSAELYDDEPAIAAAQEPSHG